MELIIKINMENDAFVSNGRKNEVKRIINELFKNTSMASLEKGGKTLMDINGNSVGYAEVL